LDHEGPVTHSEPKNDPSVDLLPEIALQKLNAEIAAGRLQGPFTYPPFEPFHISPIKLTEKHTKGTYRLIHNLSWPYDDTSINSNIPESSKHVNYHTVMDAIQIIMKHPRGSYTMKTDIKDAFKLIPIHPQDHHKLGIKFRGQYYYDTTLPQGASSACRIFERFSTSIDAIHEFDVGEDSSTHYLDDFFFVCLTLLLALHHRIMFDKLCEDINIPQAPAKKTTPSHTTEYLGIILDSLRWRASLPTEKLVTYTEHLTRCLGRKSITQKELQSLVGKLSFAAAVVPARAFLSRLIGKIYTVSDPRAHINITDPMREDMRTWRRFLKNYNGVTYFRMSRILPSNHLNMASDASLQGYGATFGAHWLQDSYPPHWRKLYASNIIGSTFLEMYPLYVLISLFGHNISNRSVLYKTDNQGVVDIINKQSSSSNHIMSIVRPLVLLLIYHNISLHAQHVPGVTHILCDKISRFQVTPKLLIDHGMDQHPTLVPHRLRSSNFKML
jgi:hypothetical protein